MTTWWVRETGIAALPFFGDLDLEAPKAMSVWLCAREQLWAIREGLTDDPRKAERPAEYSHFHG